MIKGIIREIFKSPVVVGERYVFDDTDANDPFDEQAGFWRCTVKEIKDGYVQYERDKSILYKMDSCDIASFRLCWKPE